MRDDLANRDTSAASMSSAPRVAGQHARAMKNRQAKRGVTAVVLVFGVLVIALVALGLGWATVGVEAIVIAALVFIDRYLGPIVDRWRSGALGEEHVGAVIDGLRPLGWLALHDVSTGRGNIDHVLVGPGGIFTIETKGHGGTINTAAIEPWMLKQAYAEAKFVERAIGDKVQPLLVFSRAYLTPAGISSRDGVTIVAARMLHGHLSRRETRLTADQALALHDRLSAALSE